MIDKTQCYSILIDFDKANQGQQEDFKEKIKRYIFMENAFPSPKETTDACIRFGCEAFGIRVNEDDNPQFSVMKATRRAVSTNNFATLHPN